MNSLIDINEDLENFYDFEESDRKHKYDHVFQKIIEKLKDKNWKIRYIMRLVLLDMESLPIDFELSLIDQLKAKFASPHKIN